MAAAEVIGGYAADDNVKTCKYACLMRGVILACPAGRTDHATKKSGMLLDVFRAEWSASMRLLPEAAARGVHSH